MVDEDESNAFTGIVVIMMILLVVTYFNVG